MFLVSVSVSVNTCIVCFCEKSRSVRNHHQHQNDAMRALGNWYVHAFKCNNAAANYLYSFSVAIMSNLPRWMLYNRFLGATTSCVLCVSTLYVFL